MSPKKQILQNADNKNSFSKEHHEFLKKVRKRKLFIWVMRAIVFVLIFVLWEIAGNLRWIDPFIYSQPSKMWKTFLTLHQDGLLYHHIAVTVGETVLGFLLGTILGTIIAILLWWSDCLSKILDPYLIVLNSLPKVALGPVIIVWAGAGYLAILTMALLVSLFTTIINVFSGLREVDKEKVILVKSFGGTKRQVLQKVVLPASFPTIMNALKINVGLSWIGVIMGEFLVSKAGLGYLITYGSQVFDLDLVMTSIIILAMAAALMYVAVASLEKRLLKNRR